MSRVAIAPAPSYEYSAVYEAVQKCFSLLKPDLQPPQGRVLLKPNMISPKPPEAGACTHPAVLKAAADFVKKEYGCTDIRAGDSPGGVVGNIQRFWDTLGYSEAAEEGSFSLVSFETGEMEQRTVTIGTRKKEIRIAREVLEADYVINLPKLKTHSFTLYTGALKNIYGIIPGLLKAGYHTEFRHPFAFASFIAAINSIFRPDIHIMDAVTCMEGEGPSAGKTRKIGYILASSDPAALDATAARIIGVDPETIPTIRYAGELGIGCTDTQAVEYPGIHPDDIQTEPFALPSSTRIYTRIPPFIYRMLYSLFRTRPRMNSNCIVCGKCTRVCPVQAISQEEGSMKVDYSRCISCFCCSEMCEYDGIDLNASWLARKLLPGGKERRQ